MKPSALALTLAMVCASSPDFKKHLFQAYGEKPVAFGVEEKTAITVFNNPRTGTWTIVRDLPAGLSCPLAAGEKWAAMPAGEPM